MIAGSWIGWILGHGKILWNHDYCFEQFRLVKIVAADFNRAVKAGLNSIDKDIDHSAVMHQSAFKHENG